MVWLEDIAAELYQAEAEKQRLVQRIQEHDQKIDGLVPRRNKTHRFD